jgi:hypothetical protein
MLQMFLSFSVLSLSLVHCTIDSYKAQVTLQLTVCPSVLVYRFSASQPLLRGRENIFTAARNRYFVIKGSDAILGKQTE